MDFITLASQLQKELDGERLRIKEYEQKVIDRDSAVNRQLELAQKMTGENTAKKLELQQREDNVSQRELRVRRDQEVQADYNAALAKYEEAKKVLKLAEDEKLETKMLLEDLSRRETALSDDKKTYRDQIRQEIANRMLGV